MTLPVIPPGQYADESIGAYSTFIDYLNAVSAAVDANTAVAGGLGDSAALDVGTTAGTVASGDDSRLSDARTPTVHAASHASGGGDAVTLTQSQITGLTSSLAAKAPRTGLYLPGASGNYASAPYVPGLGITGDIDIRWVGSLNSWTGTVSGLVSRYSAGGGNICFALLIDTSGRPYFLWSPDGSTLVAATIATPTGFSAGAIGGVRVTMDVDNGSGGRVITAYTSADEGATWTQLGAAITQAGTTSIYNSTSKSLEVGGYDLGTGGPLAGRVLTAEVRSGINGTVVASPDFRTPIPSGRQRDGQGNIWTINGSAWAWSVV